MASALRKANKLLIFAGMVLSVALSSSRNGFAQACSTTTGTVSIAARRHTISVAELQVSEQAWDHFYKAAAAKDDKDFDREAGKALAIAPKFADVYVLRAARELQAGHIQAALASITIARHLQPDVPWSSILVAEALSRERRFDEAAAELDRARGSDLDSWQWKFERARAEIGRRNPEGSLRWSALAVAAVPGECPEVHLLRLDAFLIAGQKKEAIAEMETYLRLDARPEVREQVVRILGETRTALQGEARRVPQPDAAVVAGVDDPATH